MTRGFVFAAVILGLGLGARNAAAAAGGPGGPEGAGWAWTTPSIGQLGPLALSNPLFERAVAGRPVGAADHPARSTDGESNDSSKAGPVPLLIAGGAAAGLGIFIGTLGGGSGSNLTDNGPPNVPGTPGTPGGGGLGGNNNPNQPPGGGPSSNSGGSNSNVGDPTTVTPEPATMALLATGLAGMGGLQLRRHRKRMQGR